jgi:hypothetical protein
MLTIYTIATPNGIYITDRPESRSYDRTCLKALLVNGQPLKPTFHENWFIVDETPYSVARKEAKAVNQRFELSDPETFPNLQQVYVYGDVHEGEDDGEEYFTYEFEKIKALYVYKSDRLESIAPVEFEVVELAHVDLVPGVVPFSYEVGNIYKVKEASVKYPILTQITVPSLLHPLTPCLLSSKDTYDIIRYHVKRSINPEVAQISSDHDFCFAVNKLIERYEPEEYKVNVNQFKRRQPKYETRYRKNRDVKVFEMTHEESKYKGYTIIKGFSANSQAELADVIDTYLEELMIMINEPLADCPHCKGLGVVHK